MIEYTAFSAERIKLVKGQKIWNIYWPNEPLLVGAITEDNFIYIDNVYGKYSHFGDASQYSVDEQFAIKAALKYHKKLILEKEKELDKMKEVFDSLLYRLNTK